jgi:transcriptional regulator
VHLRGTVEVLHGAEEIMQIVSDLQRDHEVDREKPWDMATANQDFLNELVRHVVGFTVQITSVEAKYKMEQKKDLTDRATTVNDLLSTARPEDLQVAAEMKRLFSI